jgi:uncharacterized protein YndB with AHSA1/START domain
MSKTKTLEFKQKVGAPPEAVYYAFTNRTAIREWLCDSVEIDTREGGRLHFWWNSGYYMTGAFTRLEENKAVEYTWNGTADPGPTTVSVALAPDGGGTLVTLTHGGVGSGEEWKATAAEIEKGWRESLENLASVLETGIDLRIARTPMLGILPGIFVDEESAEKYGLPKDAKGNVLDGLVPGLGAEAAGLKPGDVLLTISGVEMNDYPAYARAVGDKHVGDVIELVYWRDGQRMTVDLTLSARPMPEVPASPKDLAKAIRKAFDQTNGELDGLLDGVSEEEASHRPAEGEWSVKEVLAHLILGDRVAMSAIAVMVSGQELRDFPGNIQAQIDGLVAAYPTLDAIREEMRRTQAETVAFVASLPEDFAARKGSYMRVGRNLLQGGYHVQVHLAQMQAALETARQ